MSNKNLMFFIILIEISLQFEYLYGLVDMLYRKIEYSSIDTINCDSIDVDNFYFRGRLSNIYDIIEEKKIFNNNTKIDEYKLVYIPEIDTYKDYAKFFSISTIFVVKGGSYNKEFYIQPNCHFILDLFYSCERQYSYDTKKVHYYLVISKYIQRLINWVEYNLALFVVGIPIYVLIFFIYTCRLCVLLWYFNLGFYAFTRRILLLCLFLLGSNLFLEYVLACSLIHSLFKSYVFVNLYFLLDGYSIINFDLSKKLFYKYFLLCFIFDGVLNTIFEYMVYYLPTLDNFYFFIIKSLSEHITLLVYIQLKN